MSEPRNRSYGGRLSQFRNREDGSMVIFGLFLFVVMLAVAGLSLDLMRYEAHRVRLQNTLDTAVLAAASLSQTAPAEDVVADYFDKAGLGGFLETVTVDDTMGLRRVSATARMNINTTLMKLSGVSELSAPAAGAAEESASSTEISLVLDVSGSMARASSSGNSKNWELRHAARQFVNILQCDPSRPNATGNCTVEEGVVSISMIPYSEQVLAGEELMSRLHVTSEHTDSTCITFDADDFESTEMLPNFPPFNTMTPHKRTGHFDPWSNGRYAYDSNRTCKIDDWREVIPWEANPAVLRHRLNNLGASGNTSIDVGLKWAAALLDPSMQMVVDSMVADNLVSVDFEDRPYAYDEPQINKVIVLMTDGVNTSQHYLNAAVRDGISPVYYNDSRSNRFSVYRQSNGQYYWPHNRTWKDHAYGDGQEYVCNNRGRNCRWQDEPGSAVQYSYTELWKNLSWDWYQDFSWLPDEGGSLGNNTKNARMLDLCDAAKAHNITIFTIGFEVPDYSDTVMRNCASSPAHYFDVDGADLTDAFAAIARQISALRLVN